MKKFFAFFILFSGLAFASMAQQGGFDPAKMKEREIKNLKEANLGLTDVQADSVVSINFQSMQQMRGFRDLSQDDRIAKMKEVDAYRKKRWAEVLQNGDLVKKVTDYYEQRRAKRMQERGGQ